MEIEKSLNILKESGIIFKKRVNEGEEPKMRDKMKLWELADEIVTEASLKLKGKGIEYTEPSLGVDRFRKTVGKKVAEVDISLLTNTGRFKFNLIGFRYDDEKKRYEDRILKRVNEFEEEGKLAEEIEEMLITILSKL